MLSIDTLVIGAGHAGLAVSRCLTEYGIEHVLLERGQLAQRWRSARWDSFRLLTPKWMSRLPGHQYQGQDPDGFMSAGEFITYLEVYARSFAAPVLDRTTVEDVRETSGGYLVRTDHDTWTTRHVVIATGYHTWAQIPLYGTELPRELTQLTAPAYRRPAQLHDGAVLVVGASATGTQIAAELVRTGRRVVLAVGGHTRLPRRYRGRDIFWWLDRTGSLGRTIDELPDPDRARREPSLQLAGTGQRVDLVALKELGVQLTGRLLDVQAGRARFADDLSQTTADADARMRRVLARVDSYVASTPAPAPPERPLPALAATSGLASLPLAGIAAVVWATALRPRYPWLNVPVLDHTGRIQHRRGVTAAPGLYAVGLRFQHRRDATFIDGARHDATYLVDHIQAAHSRKG